MFHNEFTLNMYKTISVVFTKAEVLMCYGEFSLLIDISEMGWMGQVKYFGIYLDPN